jgi:hypothetical protein
VWADWFLQLEELLEQRGGQVSRPVPVNVPAKPEVYTGHPPGMARERRTRCSAPCYSIVVILMLVGTLPTWPHSRDWGYVPSGGLGLVVLILLILFLAGRL